MATKYYDKVIVPQNEINKKNIERLFSIVTSFDMNQINNFTSEYNTSYNVTDNMGNSVLHIIIRIDDINKTEDLRLHLIKFFIDNGVDVDVPDSNNVTPLHLACKKQYYKIAEYLIENGAETSNEDSQMMTPLHYAVQGHTKVCEKYREIRSLIDLPDSKDVEKIDELKNVKKEIATLLYKVDSLNKYISHIVETIKCTPDYDYKNSIKNQLNELMNNILKKLADKTTSYDKTSQGIQIEIYNTIKSVTSKFNDIHKRSLNNVDFELITNDDSAWGIENINTKLLKSENIGINKEKIIKNIIKYDQEINVEINQLENNSEILSNEPSNFLSMITNNRILAHYLIFSNNNINRVPQNASRADINTAIRNMINFEDEPADKKLMLELDDTIKHKFAVSLKDSIFNFETSSYVQGFYDYRIKRIQRFNINQGQINHNLYFYNILAEILEIDLSNNGEEIRANEGITQWFTRRRIPIQGTFENEAFLFMILNNCLRNSDLRTLQVKANLFIINIQINPFLKCHFEDVCKNFTNINFILISCINAYFRIMCQQCNTSDNNFNRYMKVLYDCLENWNKNGDLDKVKFIVYSNTYIPADTNQLIDLLLSNNDVELIKDTINNSFNGINFDRFIESINVFSGKTTFEEQIVNHVLKMLRNDKIKYCEETQIQKIEIAIEMIKYHFENNENGLKDKIKLHNLINFLRNLDSIANFDQIHYSGFLNFDTIGLEIQEEELLAESSIQSMVAKLGATLLFDNPAERDRIAGHFRNPDIQINPNEVESLIHFSVRSVSNDPFESILAFVETDFNGPQSYFSNLIDLYSVTNDLPFSLSKVYQSFGVNQYGCTLIKEVLYQIQENPRINRRDLSSLINNICVANIMNLEYIGKTNILKRHNNFNIGNNQILAKGHRLLNPGQPNERIDGTFYLGEFVEIRDLLPDRITADYPCFYNRAYNTMRVSDCTSYSVSIQSRIKRQIKLIKNIVLNQSTSQSVIEILKSILDNNFVNYENIFNTNWKYSYEAINDLKQIVMLKNIENQFIKTSIENYQKKLEFIVNQKNKNNNLEYFNIFSNFQNLSFKETKINTDELFNIFKEINALKYFEAAINSVDNYIELNQFYDGKISEDINKLVYHDTNLRQIPDPTFYKGKMLKLSDFINENLKNFTTQGKIGLSNVVYRSSFLERASTSVTPIISDYLYLIKKELCKKIVEFIYQNKELNDASNPDKPSVSKKIYDNVKQYIDKTKIYFEDQDKDAIILSLIGGLSNEVLGKYIQYIHTKYASALVEKSIKANIDVTDDKLTRNDGSNRPLIIDYKENFTNSLEKPSSKLIEGFLQAVVNSRGFSPFRFTYDPIISQELQVNDQFYIYNNDYTSGIVNDDSALCLEVNHKLIELLINNYCPINKRDKDGQSAIFYTIKNQHLNSLKKLLELEADYYSVPNKLNQTPIQYSQDLYTIHLDYIHDKNMSKMIKKFYNQQFNITKNIIIDNPAFRNNFIKYTETGYGMMIGLINHWVLNRNLDYNQVWTFDDKQNLFNLLELPDKTISRYHILDILNNPENVNIILEEREELHVLKYQIKEYKKNIDKLNKTIADLDSSIDSLQKDMDTLNPGIRQNLQNKINNQTQIKIEQRGILDDYQVQLYRLETNINNLVINNSNNLEEIPTDFEAGYNILTQSVIQNYNNINSNMPSRPTKFDSHCYNKMWDIYLNDDEILNNINNFHLQLVKLEKSILQDNDKNRKLTYLKIVSKFYDKLYLDFTEYLNKPKFTDSNKLLETSFDFIKHITKNILAEGFTMSIKDIIFEELRSSIPYDPIIHVTEETYFNLLFNMLDDVFNIPINLDGDNYELDDYIKNQINDTIVKNVLNIKANYQDVSPEDYEGVEEILKRVNEMLRLNTKIVFNEDSKSLTYINKYLIPYYSLNYKLVITNLKEIFDNYASFIVNNKRHLDVVIKLLEA